MMYTIYALSSNPISTITVKAEGMTFEAALQRQEGSR